MTHSKNSPESMSQSPPSSRAEFVCDLEYYELANALADCKACGWPIGKHRTAPLSLDKGPFKPPPERSPPLSADLVAELPLNEKGEPVDWEHAVAVIKRLTADLASEVESHRVNLNGYTLLRAERERLTAEVEKWRNHSSAQWTALTAERDRLLNELAIAANALKLSEFDIEKRRQLADENDRLRAALERIASCPSPECARDPFMAKSIAREALAGGGKK